MSASTSDNSAPHTKTKAPQSKRWRRFKWAVRIVALCVLIGYPVLIGFDGCFYVPNRTVYQRPEDFGLKYEDVHFQTADALTLHGWFFPAATPGSPRGTVIHMHGNAANVTAHLSLVWWLPHEGYNLLMFDYRGFGESRGRVTRAGTIADGNAAVDYALSRADVRAGPVFIYGQSLGAAIGIVVAADRPEIAGVVAESPFSGYRRIAALHVQRMLLSDTLARGIAHVAISGGYDPIDVVARIAPRPLLVIVAENDAICYPEMGRELFEAAGEPKELWVAPGAEHLDIVNEHEQELMQRVTELFQRAGAR